MQDVCFFLTGSVLPNIISFVCATNASAQGIIFRSYNINNDPNLPSKICDAALATLANITSFKPIDIRGRSFYDGELSANDPAEEVESEASRRWCPKTGNLEPLVKCFISLGAGTSGKKVLESNASEFLALGSILMEKEHTERLTQKRRIQFDVELNSTKQFSFGDLKATGEIEQAVERYLTNTNQEFLVRSCIQNLGLKQPTNPEEPPRPQLRHEDYTIGWLCAMPIEQTVALHVLDEVHQDLPLSSRDTNIYHLGRVGQLNVVLVTLPTISIGIQSEAAITQMIGSFPNIRFGLTVGIGGGVPSVEADIRLGDVVVSQPDHGHSGFVHYYPGKSAAGVQTSSHSTLPPILLAALSSLKARQTRSNIDLFVHISEFDKLPEPDRDILFQGDYSHTGGDDCTLCDPTRIIHRKERHTKEPHIHYGTIASGDQMIRDGVTRDRLSSEIGEVMCFDTEAAELTDNFPWLAIRGICDYTDSHRNQRWQAYAATTAAAYAKELLLAIPATEVSEIDVAGKASEDTGKCTYCIVPL